MQEKHATLAVGAPPIYTSLMSIEPALIDAALEASKFLSEDRAGRAKAPPIAPAVDISDTVVVVLASSAATSRAIAGSRHARADLN